MIIGLGVTMKKNKKNKISSFFSRDLIGWLLIAPTVVFFMFLVWRPMILSIIYSFCDIRGFVPQDFVGLQNYKDVLTDTNFLQTLGNTVKYVLWSLIIGLPLPFVGAVMLNEMIRGKQFFKIATYLPTIIPAMAVFLVWKYIYGEGDTGLINQVLTALGSQPITMLANKSRVIPLIITTMSWHGFGYTLIMYLSMLQSVDTSLYEAARLDGAGFGRRLWHVTMPRMRGIILLMAVKQIIGVFGVTQEPMVMTGGGPNGASMSLGLTGYYYAFRFNQPARSIALGVITFIILINLTFVYFKLEKKFDD